ncbi:MAG: YkvA family protein [Thermodesulfobacteriota bacterium]
MDRKSLRTLLKKFTKKVDLYRRIIVQPRCPRITRICLGAAIAYALSPIDLIPDFIPVLGYIDDAVILPILVYIALRFVPKELVEEVRAQIETVER